MSNGTCSIQGCARPSKARSWCSAHYEQWRKRLGPAASCSVVGCDRKAYAKTWCSLHYDRQQRLGSFALPLSPNAGVCADCDAPAKTRGLCGLHYNRMTRRSGSTIKREPFNLSDVDAAWLAGLFEGEGCIHITKKRYVRLSIKMTDRDVLERVAALTTGRTLGAYDRPGYNKTLYDWGVSWRPDVEELLNTMLPWFGERRRAKALEALEALHGQSNPMVATPPGR